MTNEELAACIQAGGRERLSELWGQVERFVARKARQRMILYPGLGGATFDDLYNSGYLALVAAVDTYDPEAGKTFLGWFVLALRTAFAEAGDYRGRRQACDPLQSCGSLDAPLDIEDDGSATVGDLQADPAAADAFAEADRRMWLEALRAALAEAMEGLPEPQRQTLRQRYWDRRTRGEIAASAGVHPEKVRLWERNALQALRRKRRLREFVEDRTPYYRNFSAKTGERTTEMIVLKRETLVAVKTGQPLGAF